ncbi:MAG: hypothetical protein QOF69_2292 [Solirubrobacteraceae bacterium]|nr:hypothetical protein [Solirubrobacteraceae bacterium]
MSITYTCNLCGETIEGGSPLVVLNGDGERSANHWRSGWIGHYHADPTVGCWQRILDIIRAADGRAPRLDSIPTAADESIADARSKHRLRAFRRTTTRPTRKMASARKRANSSPERGAVLAQIGGVACPPCAGTRTRAAVSALGAGPGPPIQEAEKDASTASGPGLDHGRTRPRHAIDREAGAMASRRQAIQSRTTTSVRGMSTSGLP